MPERQAIELPRKKMPGTTKLIAGAALLLTALGALTLTTDGRVDIAGSGVVMGQDRSVEEFDSIHSRSAVDVHLSQGSERSVRVEGEDNLLSFVSTTTRNGVLIVDTQRGRFTSTRPLVVHVRTPEIRGIKVSGSGNVTGQSPFTVEGLELDVSGSGDIDVEGVFEAVESVMSGSGDIFIGGSADNLSVDLKGSGTVAAQNLQVSGETEVGISGSGNCAVWADGELEVELEGSGDVRYKGATRSVSTDISGSGRVERLK